MNKQNKSNKAHKPYDKKGSRDSEIKDIEGKGFIKGKEFKVTPGTHDKQDVDWYITNPQLLRDAASIAMSYPLGNPNNVVIGEAASNAIPGVAAAHYVPMIGVTTEENDPVNIAMRIVYSNVRYANSGARNYDAPDLMQVLLAEIQAYAYLGFMQRMYGVARTYSASNRYYPKAILTAMGADASNIITHLADFRAAINVYAAKLATFALPAQLKVCKRQIFLASEMFKDSSESKSQTYLYVPDGFFQYTMSNASLGELHYKPIFESYNDKPNWQYSDFITYGNEILDALVLSEDANIINGDILKAYGNGELIRAELISEDFVVQPKYNPEVLTQIENTIFMGWQSDASVDAPIYSMQGAARVRPYVSQNANVGEGQLWFDPRTDGMEGWNDGNKFYLNFHTDTVTPEMIMVATRNMEHVSNIGKITAGTEVFTNFRTYTYKRNNSLGTISLSEDIFSFILPSTGSTYDNERICILETFDWHPCVFLATLDGQGDIDEIRGPMLEIDNYGIISESDLKKLHLAAITAEFGIPDNTIQTK